MAVQRTDSSTKSISGMQGSTEPTSPSITTSEKKSLTRRQSLKSTKTSSFRRETPAVNLCQSPRLWLIIWTCNNIGITLLNKAAFATVDFRYPYFLSALHMAINAMGAQFIFWTVERRRNDDNSKGISNSEEDAWITKMFGNLQRQSLDKKGRRLILMFSVVFAANIAIGNVSLQHVSVNFNQVMRSLVPALTIAMGFALGRPTSMSRQVAVIPVIIGVAMACFGDMTYTAIGFGYTFLCILLAALKVVASGELLTGSLKMHPFDLLGHMAPLAFMQCILLAGATGEVRDIAARWDAELNPAVNFYPFFVVVMSGVLSFFFNISSLQTNKLTSPLTLCIAGNVKQVLMIVIATAVFNTPITPLNAAGIVVVLMGSAWYSYVSVVEKIAPKETPVDEDEEQGGSVDILDNSELVTLIPGTSIHRGLSGGVQRTASTPTYVGNRPSSFHSNPVSALSVA